MNDKREPSSIQRLTFRLAIGDYYPPFIGFGDFIGYRPVRETTQNGDWGVSQITEQDVECQRPAGQHRRDGDSSYDSRHYPRSGYFLQLFCTSDQ